MSVVALNAKLRLLSETDSIAELTELLHRAYASLADRGLKYVATYQDEATTLRRAQRGQCWIAEQDGKLVGTISYYPPQITDGCAWYDRPEVASFGQFAVDPELQRTGLGSRMLDRVEEQAMADGADELALDTAEPAKHLIDYYERRGYREIERVQWDVTNYVSVIMSKRLSPCQRGWPGST